MSRYSPIGCKTCGSEQRDERYVVSKFPGDPVARECDDEWHEPEERDEVRNKSHEPWSDQWINALWKSKRCEHAEAQMERTYACPGRLHAFARAVAAEMLRERNRLIEACQKEIAFQMKRVEAAEKKAGDAWAVAEAIRLEQRAAEKERETLKLEFEFSVKQLAEARKALAERGHVAGCECHSAPTVKP